MAGVLRLCGSSARRRDIARQAVGAQLPSWAELRPTGVQPPGQPPERAPLRWNTLPGVCSLFAQRITPWIDKLPVDPVTFMESTAYGIPVPPVVEPGQFPGYHMPPWRARVLLMERFEAPMDRLGIRRKRTRH